MLDRRIKTLSETHRRADRRHRDGRRRRRLACTRIASVGERARSSSPCRRSASASSPTSARPISCRGCRIALGVYLALTGLARRCGRRARARPCRRLRSERGVCRRWRRRWKASEPVEATLARFAAPPPASALIGEAELIEACFSRISTRRRSRGRCAKRSAEDAPSPRRRATRCWRNRRPARRSRSGRWQLGARLISMRRCGSTSASSRASAAAMTFTKACAR